MAGTTGPLPGGAAAPPSGRGSFRALAGGVAGNVIEWYDFALYGYLAVVISRVFFPPDDPTAALIAAYGIFAAGYLMRPLGGFLFGHLGDTLGRKPVLLLSVLLMAVPTVLLGLLPTYADWGLWASLALVALRMAQGLSVGGEFSGSVTYLVETAPADRRGLAGSWANWGCVVGMVLGAGTPALVIWCLGQPAVEAWAWRLPFLFGGLIGLLALLLRRGLPEPPPPPPPEETAGHPVRRLLREEPRTLALMTLFSAAYGVVFFVPVVFLPTWLALYTPIQLHEALFIATLAYLLQALLLPPLALASDRCIPRTRFLALAFLLLGVFAVPLYAWAAEGALWEAVLAVWLFCALISIPMAVAPATYAEAFDRGHRLTGYSLSFNLGFGLGGGTAPMVCTWLISASGNHLAAAFYLIPFALVGILAILSLPDRSRTALR